MFNIKINSKDIAWFKVREGWGHKKLKLLKKWQIQTIFKCNICIKILSWEANLIIQNSCRPPFIQPSQRPNSKDIIMD